MKLCLASILMLVAVGCGDSSTLPGDAAREGVDAPSDAPRDGGADTTADASVADATVDVAVVRVCDGTAAPPPTYDAAPTTVRELVIDDIKLPADQNEAAAFGYDYDGDGLPDNALGGIISGLGGVIGGATRPEDQVSYAVVRGATLHILRVFAASFVDATSASALFWPAAAQPCCSSTDATTCRSQAKTRCFGGTTTFHPDCAATALSGTISGGVGTLAGAALPLLLHFGHQPVAIYLVNARVSGTFTAAGLVAGKITGAIPGQQIRTTIIPAIAGYAADRLDDPTTPRSARDALLNLFDTNSDGTITETEVADNALIKTFLSGDVDVDSDGTLDLSFGVGFTAVPCTIQ